ncbi:hypothetical protein I5M27_08920 [Adhaeribacter sp. BT258]|uniref:Uncharacterized protein n=1 Tax=Adhaeribacter terrigena TaxID=2793070 RepID=A0ABS1C120_9BACT|nr:hypothetical protein [Adhaeribacter terrigena]MBK0403104.1 hypothetical protein [Adhaeribacter terrigena]
MSSSVVQADILTFLTSIQDDIQDMDGLLEAIRQENQRAEIYGRQNIAELMEISAYQWQLEQVEMKLKAPSLIKITFIPEGEKVQTPKTEEEKIEAILLTLIMRIIRYNGLREKEIK